MKTNKPDATQLVGDVKYDTALFCDLKTDEEKSTFFLSGRGYETGVIAQAIQNDVAMAYHRCSEYRKELEALQAECEKLRTAMIEAKSYIEHYMYGGSAYREPAAKAVALIDAALSAYREQQGGEA